jgi:hypothetical protein
MNEHDHTADEALRGRLAAADPAQRVSVDPIPDHLMEQIMTTTTPEHTDPSSPARPGGRWKLPALGGAVAAVAAVIGIATLGGTNSPATATPLELTGGDDAMMSCLPFSVDILDDMPTAFEGTVTAVEGPTVTLEVDRWYHDGTGSGAGTVVVNAPEGMEALIGGIAFEVDGQYLISADADGNVSYCGYTAPASDEMRASFEQAFPG